MNIEEMKDGNYVLIYLEGQDDEFEIEVKDGKHTINRNNHGKVSKVKDNEISLLCDLHESEYWTIEEKLQSGKMEEQSFRRS